MPRRLRRVAKQAARLEAGADCARANRFVIELLPLWMVASLMLLLFSGYPVAFVLIAVAMVFAAIAIVVGEMPVAMLQMIQMRVYSLVADNLIFPAVPPLVLMGVALSRSGAIRELLAVVVDRFRAVPGGMAITVLLVGILLAPTAGLLGAAVGTLALATLPSLLESGYRPSLAAASVAAAGTLGVGLPPAVMLFFLADLVGAPIVGMFGAVLGPASLLVVLYIAYFAWQGRHSLAGRATGSPAVGGWSAVSAVLGPVAVVASVLIPIATGWATPSQSGTFGALGALVLLIRSTGFDRTVIRETLLETAYVTAMVFMVIIAANVFSFVFRVLEGDQMVARFIEHIGAGPWGTLALILGLIFVLGFFIDWLEIVLITLPIFMPVIAGLDFGSHVGSPLMVKLWVGAAIAMVLQTSFLTPPFGFALFFLRGAAPDQLPIGQIYRGVAPLVAFQLLALMLLLAVPSLGTYLPGKLID